jgi:hypothetical protein
MISRRPRRPTREVTIGRKTSTTSNESGEENDMDRRSVGRPRVAPPSSRHPEQAHHSPPHPRRVLLLSKKKTTTTRSSTVPGLQLFEKQTVLWTTMTTKAAKFRCFRSSRRRHHHHSRHRQRSHRPPIIWKTMSFTFKLPVTRPSPIHGVNCDTPVAIYVI